MVKHHKYLILEPVAQEQKLHQTEILMNIFMEMLLSQLIQIMEQ